MNLVIDKGNTICKVAIYRGNEQQVLVEERKLDLSIVEHLLEEYPEVDAAIYSSVSQRDDELLDYLKRRLSKVLELSPKTAVPLQIGYEREKLGGDRLAAIVAAIDYAGQEAEILVVDIGTAITIERISQGLFLGGNISPGVTTRLKALNSYTARLPLIKLVQDAEGFGKETYSAIEKGVLRSVVYEIEGYIRSIKEEDARAKVYLTGGYSPLLSSFIKEDIELKADMVLYGLNKILIYNNVK